MHAYDLTWKKRVYSVWRLAEQFFYPVLCPGDQTPSISNRVLPHGHAFIDPGVLGSRSAGDGYMCVRGVKRRVDVDEHESVDVTGRFRDI